jgi:S-formylglutathione hydrolase FrmB
MCLLRKLAGLATSLAITTAAFAASATSLVATDQFRSPTLSRDWVYGVYLPDGYETGQLRYPVLYMLHGNAQDQNEPLMRAQLRRAADELIAAGEIPPCIIIMPTAGVTWYVDRQEKMETAIIQDLIPEVERRYRVIPARAGRVIGGISMGGYGALRFTLKYPELFAATALFMPAIYDPEPPTTSSARRTPAFHTNGQYDPEVWRSLNYPPLMDAFLAKNIVVPLWVDAGDDDDFQIEYHAAVLHKIWRDKNWPAEFRVVDGVHNNDVQRKTIPDALRFVFGTVRPPEFIGSGEAAAIRR